MTTDPLDEAPPGAPAGAPRDDQGAPEPCIFSYAMLQSLSPNADPRQQDHHAMTSAVAPQAYPARRTGARRPRPRATTKRT